MKKLIFFFFAVFMFYFAAIYQYSALMVLAVGQLLLLLFLSVQVYVCRSRLSTSFVQRRMTAVKGEKLFGEIGIDYRGKLPAGCVKFYMTQGYGLEQGKVRLYGNNNSGRAVFTIRSEYCGIKNIYLKRIRIYDYLFLASVKKAVSDQMQVMIFPREQVLDIRISDMEKDEYPGENLPENSRREMSGEIRQIREYREGDSRRQFHWKLSARMDTLLVKEYEKETEDVTELFLNLNGYDVASVQEKDAFCTLLSALLFGLLRERQVNVYWQEEGEGDMVKMEVTDPVRCREVLMRLYCLGEECRNGETESVQEQVPGEKWKPGQKRMAKREQVSEQRRNVRLKHAGKAKRTAEFETTAMTQQFMMPVNAESLMLDMKLCLYQGTEPLCQFTGGYRDSYVGRPVWEKAGMGRHSASYCHSDVNMDILSYREEER